MARMRRERRVRVCHRVEGGAVSGACRGVLHTPGGVPVAEQEELSGDVEVVSQSIKLNNKIDSSGDLAPSNGKSSKPTAAKRTPALSPAMTIAPRSVLMTDDAHLGGVKMSEVFGSRRERRR